MHGGKEIGQRHAAQKESQPLKHQSKAIRSLTHGTEGKLGSNKHFCTVCEWHVSNMRKVSLDTAASGTDGEKASCGERERERERERDPNDFRQAACTVQRLRDSVSEKGTSSDKQFERFARGCPHTTRQGKATQDGSFVSEGKESVEMPMGG